MDQKLLQSLTEVILFGAKREEKYKALANSDNHEDRIQAATHGADIFHKGRKAVLDKLVKDPHPAVRLAVAQHGWDEHVRELANDPHPQVAAQAKSSLYGPTPSRRGPLGLG
jgi:hypothetical protein